MIMAMKKVESNIDLDEDELYIRESDLLNEEDLDDEDTYDLDIDLETEIDRDDPSSFFDDEEDFVF
jgi:hypothetical protein